MRKVLLVDDEAKSRMGIKVILQRSDTEFKDISECDDGLEAEKMLSQHRFDLVITDIRMPNLDGISFIRHAQSLASKPKFLILSGYQNFSYAAEALKYGVKEYLLKPVGRRELIESVSKIEAELRSEDALRRRLQAIDRAEVVDGLPGTATGHTIDRTAGDKTPEQAHWPIPGHARINADDTGKIEAAIKYIHENYNKDIDLCTVSNHISLNYNYCSNLFRAKTGVRFVEYLNNYRIEKAKTLLMSKECMISDIAGMVGYTNPKHFTKIFRSITGLSPLEFRKKVRR